MTPKLKALSLIESMSFSNSRQMNYANGEMVDIPQNLYAKQCALVAVDAILKSGPRYPNDVDWDDVGGTHQYYYEAQREEADKYWKEVKQEIEKL
jgi:hypothetical protein